MTTELAIEREAKIRAQKKRILQVQKMKYLSGYLTAANTNFVATREMNKDDLFEQDRQTHLSDHKRAGERGDIERPSNNLSISDGQYYGKVNGFKTQSYTSGVRTPILRKGIRHPVDEAGKSHGEKTKQGSVTEISTIVASEEEPVAQYTPSFPTGSSEYHRKANEIKKKKAERRRKLDSKSNQHYNLFNFASTNEYARMAEDFPSRASENLQRLHSEQKDLRSASYQTKLPRYRTDVNADILLLNPFAVVEEVPQLYDSSSGPRTHRINFEGFARKQQEILEESLRRLEENLDNTFSRLRRYVKTVNIISRNEGHT